MLVLSQYVELGLALTLLADSAEGVGYLLKDRISDVDDFLAAVRRVADGGSALDPLIVSALISRQRADDPLARLTAREREVLELMAMGSSNQGIADALVITLRAVEKYVSSIFGKLGLPSSGSESRRVLAVLMFLRAAPRAGPPGDTRNPSPEPPVRRFTLAPACHRWSHEDANHPDPHTRCRDDSVRLSSVSKLYGSGDNTVAALRDVSLGLARGSFTAVMGPSGSGKSTFLHCAAGLDRPTSGTVRLGGRRSRESRRGRTQQVPPRAHRLRIPVLQPRAVADRRAEHHAAAAARQAANRRGLAERGDPARVASASASSTSRASYRAVSSSASRSPAR